MSVLENNAADKKASSDNPMCQIESPKPMETAVSLGFQSDRTNSNASKHQATLSVAKLHEFRGSVGSIGVGLGEYWSEVVAEDVMI
jgi:putative salt-induced outer membrane protein YdiY